MPAALLLPVDGAMRAVTVEDQGSVRTHIGATWVEILTVDTLGAWVALLVDEEGRLTDKPANELASWIAGFSIVGDALVVGYATGGALVDVPSEVVDFVTTRAGRAVEDVAPL